MENRDLRSSILDLTPSSLCPSVFLLARCHRLGPFDLHFIEQITRVAELFGQEKHVTNIDRDGAIGVDVVSVIAAQPFVVAVKDQPYDFAAPVHYWRA